MASLARGEMAVQEGAFDAARGFLSAAVHQLEGDIQAEAYSFLASSELHLGMFREARRSAEAGIGIKRASVSSRDARDDSLECALAEALVHLKEYERAKSVLATIVGQGVSVSKRQWASDALAKIRESGR